tara:strand:+ start:456 stop:1172 length:717 start_codon:yes stop_codon:yes gene_type:complete
MRFLIDLIENNDKKESKVLIESMISDVVTSKFTKRRSSIMNIFEEEGEATPEDIEGTLDDPMLDPNFSREYFFKRFKYEDKEIVLKRLGLGQNAPTITYINKERYEIFSTPKQAEKETIRYIKDGSFDEAMKEKEDKIAAADVAKKEEEDKKKQEEENQEKITDSFEYVVSSERPSILTFNSGEERVITVSEATDALEILKLLNNENGIEFLNRLSHSKTSYLETLDFFLDKVRKGVI